MTARLSEAATQADAELGNIRRVAVMASLSARTIRRLVDAGKMPPPLRIGGSDRWRLADVRQWIADGCPTVRRNSGGASR
jgi:predicted DNA-binding transcriptional regulator AlpA